MRRRLILALTLLLLTVGCDQRGRYQLQDTTTAGLVRFDTATGKMWRYTSREFTSPHSGATLTLFGLKEIQHLDELGDDVPAFFDQMQTNRPRTTTTKPPQ